MLAAVVKHTATTNKESAVVVVSNRDFISVAKDLRLLAFEDSLRNGLHAQGVSCFAFSLRVSAFA